MSSGQADSTLPPDSSTAIEPPERSTDSSSKSPANRLYALDLIRFIAASMVLLFHYIAVSNSWRQPSGEIFGHLLTNVTAYGSLGVELFFLVSGFVICMSSWGRSLSEFATSRITRLMPAYVIAVILSSAVIFLYPAEAGKAPDTTQILTNLTMLQNYVGVGNVDPVYWTLFIELKFYLIFAIVVWRGVTYKRVITFCWLWTIGSLLLLANPAGALSDFVSPTYSPFFIAGIAFYLMHRFGSNLILWMLLFVSWVLGLHTIFLSVAEGIASGWPVTLPASIILVTSFYLVMLAVAKGWLHWLRWRGLVTLGALTYPVYLLHYMIGRSVIREFADRVPPWLLLGLVIAGILVLAYAVHRLAERPVARRLKKGLQRGFAKIRQAETRQAETRQAETRQAETRQAETRQADSPARPDSTVVARSIPRPEVSVTVYAPLHSSSHEPGVG